MSSIKEVSQREIQSNQSLDNTTHLPTIADSMLFELFVLIWDIIKMIDIDESSQNRGFPGDLLFVCEETDIMRVFSVEKWSMTDLRMIVHLVTDC